MPNEKSKWAEEVSKLRSRLCTERLTIVFAYSQFGNKNELDDLLQQIELAIDELDKEIPNLQKVYEIYNNIFKAK